MIKYKFIINAIIIYLFCLIRPAFAQIEEYDFSEIILSSEVILHAKVSNTSTQWINDVRGKHIYTHIDIENLKTINGNINQNNISLEVIGGQVGKIKEIVSESFSANKNDELILFLQNNPLQVVYGNRGVIHVSNKGIFLKNCYAKVDEFVDVISEIVNNLYRPKNIEEVEKIILDKRFIKYVTLMESDEEYFFQEEGADNNIMGSITLPNLKPYKFPSWGDIIIVKKTIVDRDSDFASDDSVLYHCDELYLNYSFANHDIAIKDTFVVKIYVDNTEVSSEKYFEIGPKGKFGSFNRSIGSLCSGSHSIKIVVDETNEISESNESDNEYTKIITVRQAEGIPLITSITPSSASAGTNTYITIYGNNFGTSQGTSIVKFLRERYPADTSDATIQATNYLSWTNEQIVCAVPAFLMGVNYASASSGPVTVVTSSGKSNNYNFNISFGYGFLKWKKSSGQVVFKINENYSSTNDEGPAIRRAMNSWSESGANFSFVYGGGTNVSSSGYDEENSILFDSLSSRTIANCYLWCTEGDEILESDIVFNTNKNSFSTTMNYGTYDIDIESVALYELGHTLFLQSLYGKGDEDKVMYGYRSYYNEDIKRNLASGDIEGIRYIYGIKENITEYNISGIVTNNSIPLSGVNVALTGSSEQSFTTTSDGKYSFIVPANGSYLVIPTKTGCDFSPRSKLFENVISSQSKDFNAVMKDFYVTSSAGVGGTITPLGEIPIGYNSNQTFKITEDEGCHISKLLVDGSQTKIAKSYTFNNVKENHTIEVLFSKDTLNISASCSPVEGGTIIGSGNYEYGTSVSLVAKVNYGYEFVNWTDGTESLSTDSIYTFVLKSDRSLVAHFSTNTYNVSTSSEPAEGGTTTGGGNYEFMSEVVVTASPNTGYNFEYWTQDSKIVSNDSAFTFTITIDRPLIAHFSKKIFSITASSNPISGGTITGTGNYEYGSTVSLTAIPNGNFKFWNWTENGVEVSADSNYQFIAENNRTLIANYDRPPQFTKVIPPDQVVIIYITPIPVWWSFQYSGIDEDNDEISFSLIEGPNGSEISTDGLFKWSPTVDQANANFTVTVSLSDGKLSVTHSTTVTTVYQVGVEDYDASIPDENMLYQNYPNPFNPTTLIKYALTNESNVRITIYNIAGQRIENILNGIRQAGYHTIEWKSNNLPSGIYIYTIEAMPTGSGIPYRQNRKMLLLK
jgi:hypothetical protein